MKIDTAILNKDQAFRTAFAAICKAALPHMADNAYHGDLLYDAATAAALEIEDRVFILVREVGTFTYAHVDDAINHLYKTDGVAVLKVTRGLFDSFRVREVYNKDAGFMRDA
jgi:hypothetical protein